MKRFVIALVITLLALIFLAMPNGALQKTLAQEGTDFNPHGNYSSSTANCTTCHQPHSQQEDPGKVCVECHTQVQTHKENDCASCHDPHDVTTNAALIQSSIDGNDVEFDGTNFADVPTGICYTCHETTEYHSAESTESHYEERDCTECHPHSDGFALNPISCTVCHGIPPESGAHIRHFEDDIKATCTDCHPKVSEFTDEGHRDGRVDFADGQRLILTRVCSECHGNFVGVREAKTAWDAGGPVTNCLGCHNATDPSILNGNTAAGVDQYWEINGHGQVESEDGELVCESCHDPEAPHFDESANQRLWTSPKELCARCHGEPGSEGEATGTTLDQPHPHGEDRECNLCHEPHGSAFPVMVRQSQPTVCGSCHKTQVDPSVSFADHATSDDLECSACHDPHTPTAAAAQVERETCQTCHDLPEAESFEYPHQPYSEDRCSECHPSFHDNPDQPLIAATQAESCNTCHDDHGQTVEQPHPESVAGQCLACHDGHGSDHPKQLVKSEDAICQGCHTEPFDSTHTFSGHAADKLPSCTSCHSPHEPKVSGVQVLETCSECHTDILAATTTSIHDPVEAGECTECHSEFHGQKTTGLAEAESCTTCHDLEDGRIEHWPVAQGKCTSCHVPHSSRHPALLTASIRQVCSECHASQASVYRSSAHATRLTDQCVSCHKPHSGNVDNLLISRTNNLCNSCHSGLPHGFHPVSGGGLSCISCHAPHGSTHESDLRASGDALCLTCHDFQQN